MSTHPFMVVDEREVMQRTLVPDVFVPVIITSQADIRLLMLSVFSLLLRTREFQHLAHFMVFINGPDSRTGDTSLQDRKQAFLEALRLLKWPRPDGVQQDMPITVCRIWSRVGHSELCDMAMPWVHTQYYVLMHDDVIILDPDWSGKCWRILQPPDVAIATARPLLLCPAGTPESAWDGQTGTIVRLPHLNTSFLVGDKIKLAAVRATWQARHTPVSGRPFAQLVDLPAWRRYYVTHGGVDSDVAPDKSIKAISHDVGAWMYYRMTENGMRGVELPDGMIDHLGAASWDNQAAIAGRLASHRSLYKQLEDELRQYTAFWALYTRFCSPL